MKQKFASKLWKRTLSTGLSLAMAVTLLPAGELRAETTPELLKAGSIDGVEDVTISRNQPFLKGVTGATTDSPEGRPYFSSPAFTVRENVDYAPIVGECTTPTASNTVLIAAAEARFDQEKKAGGTDVVAAISKDKGATWTYSYPMRFPDSAGNAGENATSVDNPVLAVDKDGTIYCLMNLTPTGVSSLVEGEGITYPKVGTGYVTIDDTDRLALYSSIDKANGAVDGYEYYVGDWNTEQNSLAIVYNKDKSESNYAVDKWYNLYQKDSEGTSYTPMKQKRATATGIANGSDDVQQNVFYAGSQLHVFNTSYIACVTSENGLTWSAPEILNPYIRLGEVASLVVSGGKGLKTSDNRIVFPVYRNDKNSEADGEASIIWLDKSATGDNKWHRSEKIPNYENENDENEWIGNGEIAELSDGKLRMVFTNGQGVLGYADAERDIENNKFVFSAPGLSDVKSPNSANPSVISYLNQIEDKKALLVAAPVGERRQDGRIITFVKGEEGETGMPYSEEMEVPGTKDYFRNPCMDQFNAGNQIGLVWESGDGIIRFSKFAITEVVKDHYIPHLTVDIDLTIGETYHRKYVVAGKTHMDQELTKPATEDVVKVSVTPGSPISEEVPALYASNTNVSNGFTPSIDTIKDGFINTYDSVDRMIEKAEFTITRPDNSKPEEFVVYSALEKRYFKNKDATSNFQATRPTYNIIITKTPENHRDGIQESGKIDEGQFAVLCSDNKRPLFFNGKKLRFDGQNSWHNDRTQLDAGMTFLQKLHPDEVLTGEDKALELIPGYKKVTEITPNEKYLITYPLGTTFTRGGEPFGDENTMPIALLYPRNGIKEQVKLVYGTRTVERKAKQEISVTATGEGEAQVVANHVTYNFHCHPKNLELRKGEKKFFAGYKISACTSQNPDVATVEAYTQKVPSLFDCEKKSNNDLNGYSSVANTDIDMTGAEFIFTSVGSEEDELYTIQGASEDNRYLINENANQNKYFQNTPITQKVSRSATVGAVAFEIQRKSSDNYNNRYLYFYYESMTFEGLSEKNASWESKGKFDFELLEKQEYPSDTDVIRGYRRVEKITSGKRYLITQTYDKGGNDSRFVLYPGNLVTDYSKLYQDVKTNGVLVTAVGNPGEKTDITIGETVYPLEITGACNHIGYAHYLQGTKDADCETAGYTGDEYCENCDEKIPGGEGDDTPALGHNVMEWSVKEGDEPSFEADGQYTGTCVRCAEEITRKYTKEEYATEELEKIVATANTKSEADYTAKSYAPLKDALDKVDDVEDTAAAKKVLYDEIVTAIGGLESKTEFDAAKNQLKAKLVSIKAALAKNEEDFDPAVWTALGTAVNELKADTIGIDLSTLADADAIEAKLDTLALTVLNTAWEKVENVSTNTITEEKEQQKREKLKADIKTALSAAKPVIDSGKPNYTEDSWNALKDAYNAANLSDTALEAKTTQELEDLLDALNEAQENLEEKQDVTDPEIEAAKTAVANAVKDADAIATAGQKNYDKTAWDAFMAAYNAAKDAPADADAATLNRLAKALADAQKALGASVPKNEFVKGATEDAGGIRYQVLDANQKTVTALMGLSKDTKNIIIPATVKVKGETCNVVEISDNAFKGFNKATNLTIGANVTTIGKNAFASCKKLKKVTLQSKVLKSVKGKAFKGTAKKVKVKWPKGLKAKEKNKLKKMFKKAKMKVK